MVYDIVHGPVLRFMSVSEMERVAPAPDSVSSTAAAAGRRHRTSSGPPTSDITSSHRRLHPRTAERYRRIPSGAERLRSFPRIDDDIRGSMTATAHR